MTTTNWLDRVRQELAELDKKRSKLDQMLQGDKPEYISDVHWDLLKQQCKVMAEYALILAERIENA